MGTDWRGGPWFPLQRWLESVTELDSVSDIAQLRIGTVVGPDIGGKVTVSGAVTNPTDGGWDHFVPGNRS